MGRASNIGKTVICNVAGSDGASVVVAVEQAVAMTAKSINVVRIRKYKRVLGMFFNSPIVFTGHKGKGKLKIELKRGVPMGILLTRDELLAIALIILWFASMMIIANNVWFYSCNPLVRVKNETLQTG